MTKVPEYRKSLLLFRLGAVACLVIFSLSQRAVARSPSFSWQNCFPVEQLVPRERRLARQILRRALAGHAFYTLAEPLKPAASDFVEPFWDMRSPGTTLAKQRFESVISTLKCGEDLFFHAVTEEFEPGQLHSNVFIGHGSKIRAAIRNHSEYFAELGISARQKPEMILEKIFSLPGYDRFVGFGVLFGFPPERVTFFTEAMIQNDQTGKFVPRDFFKVPVLQPQSQSPLAWAIPKGAKPMAEELAFRMRAKDLRRRFRKVFGHRPLRYPERALRTWLRQHAESGDLQTPSCSLMLVPDSTTGGSD